MAEPPVETGVDHIHAHPRHTGHRWLDMILAISAITISVISLFVAIEHGRTEEKLVAAGTWPFLVYNSTREGLTIGSRIITLSVSNGGVGPARIQSARITLDGKPMHTHGELLHICCGFVPGEVQQQITQGLRNENALVGVLPARETDDLLSMQETPGNAALWAALSDARHRVVFSVCYCSVLDECWTTDLKSTTEPARVPNCRPGADDYTE